MKLKFVFTLLIAIACLNSPLIGSDFLLHNYAFAGEPTVRIGLIRNATSVAISTRDSSLAGGEVNGVQVDFGTTSMRVTSRTYKVPEFGIYRFEIPAIETLEEAEDLAANILTETGEQVRVTGGDTEETWKVVFESERDFEGDADAFVAYLTEKGFLGVKINVEKYTSPSDDAILLSRQITFNPKSQVRSLTSAVPRSFLPPGIQTISSSRPVRQNMNAAVSSGLREISTSGSSSMSKLESLRAVTIGSADPRGIVYLDGKRYRGKMEIFANSSGRITVVNVVPMEDYLLGVVPAELSLPEIEAQKAQAVAARTYAAANKDTYGIEGFDMLPTVWSQVYKGVAIESRMGSQAVRDTRGIIATYGGKPINALYTSTCGGRTENSGNIYDFDEPYLRGVNCSLNGKDHFAPFIIKTDRQPALIRNESNYQYVRLASRFAVNNFVIAVGRFDDEYFEDPPSETELRSWINQLAVKFNKPFPVVSSDSSRPLNLARLLYGIIYPPTGADDADTLLSESDIEYHLALRDAAEIPKADRAILAELLRDGWFSVYSDLTLKPNRQYPRSKILGIIDNIYNKKKWQFEFESGTANPTEDGKLLIKRGRNSTEILVEPNVFLFRKFGDSFYQVTETSLLGGETVRYKTNVAGRAVYIEVEPTESTTVAERMSPFTTWRTTVSASQVRSRLARYVKGMGALIDVRIKQKGVSRRATELEIITTNGVHSLKGGKIRSALRLREQLFVMDKRYSSNGRVASISFTGRGWGHGIGMCQYGAYGLAKMGVKYDRILKHYYTGVDLVKAY